MKYMNLEYGDISKFILIITAIIATIYHKKQLGTPLRFLKYYLWYAVVLEVGAPLLWTIFGIGNTWWYNVGINIEILFYLFLFYQYIENKKTMNFILIGGVIYEAYFLINYLLLSESWNTYQNIPFSIGGFLIILIVFIFLVEMFRSDKILYITKYLIFWVSLGLLFYNIIPLPFFVVRKIIPSDLEVYLMNIQFTANILMYVSFIYGFIWSTMKYK